MANRNINVTRDDLDRPNAGTINTPENHSVRDYIKKPQINWVAVLLFASIPGLIGLILLVSLWFWSSSVVNSYNPNYGDWIIAWVFRIVIVGSIPAALFGWIVLSLYRGYVWVTSSWLVRAQNNQPSDARTYLLTHNQEAVELLKLGLQLHYQTENIWAAHSDFRNISGVYSPTITNSPAQLVDHNPGGDDVDEAVLTLPPEVGLDDVQNDIPPGHIAYGVGLHGNLITAPVGSAYHAIRQGDTGSGKTTNLNSELVQIHQIAARVSGRFEVYAGDFKGEFDATWGKSPLIVGGVSTAPNEIAEMLEDCMKEITRRYELFTQMSNQHNTLVRNLKEYSAVTGERIPYRLVYLDEVNALLGGTIPRTMRARIDAALKRGLQLGRGAGVFYECGAQYMTADLFDREGSKQFVTRAYFGGWDVTAMNMVFLGKVDQRWGQEYSHLLDGSAGRGVYAGVGGKPVPFQGLNVSVEDILGSIAALSDETVDTRASSPQAGRETPETPFAASETPETLSGLDGVATITAPVGNTVSSVSNRFHDDPQSVAQLLSSPTTRQYLISQVRRLAQQNQGKKAIILHLFNARPGRSADYEAASAFYDQVVRGA